MLLPPPHTNNTIPKEALQRVSQTESKGIFGKALVLGFLTGVVGAEAQPNVRLYVF